MSDSDYSELQIFAESIIYALNAFDRFPLQEVDYVIVNYSFLERTCGRYSCLFKVRSKSSGWTGELRVLNELCDLKFKGGLPPSYNGYKNEAYREYRYLLTVNYDFNIPKIKSGHTSLRAIQFLTEFLQQEGMEDGEIIRLIEQSKYVDLR